VGPRSRIQGRDLPGRMSWVEDLGSKVPRRGSRIEVLDRGPESRSRVEGPGSRVPVRRSRFGVPVWRSRFGVPGRRSRVEGPGSGPPGSKIPGRGPGLGSRVEGPGSKVPGRGPGSLRT